MPILLYLCVGAKAQNYNAGALYVSGEVFDASGANGTLLSTNGNVVVSNGGIWFFDAALLTTPRSGTLQSEVIKFTGNGSHGRNTGYVNGYAVAESKAASFVLPIGHSGYMPLTINTAIAPGNSIIAAWYDDKPDVSTNISGTPYFFLPGYYDIRSASQGLNVLPSVPAAATSATNVLGTNDGINFVDLGTVGTLGSGTVLPSGYYQLRFANSSPILPVTLTAFTAKRQGNKSQLQWKLTAEHNVKEYIVERSREGRSYSTVGTQPSLGPTAQERTYTLYDASPFNGANYYRIKTVDEDGKTSYSAVVELSFDMMINITVYPNPVRDYAIISGVENGMQVTVFDLTGQKLLQKEAVANRVEINLKHLPAAVYRVVVQDDAGKIKGSFSVIKK